MADKKKRTFEPLPYYPWYWRDYRASRAVQRMHWQARGLYRELLDECWVKGGVPDDATACASIANCPARDMERHWSAIRAMFAVDESGLLVNERMENERTESDTGRVGKSKGGKISAEVRKGKRVKKGKNSSTPVNTSSGPVEESLTSRAVQSSSEQSKAVAVQRVDDPTRAPIAALAPQGARGVGGPQLFGQVFEAMARAGAKPIGFTRDGES